MNWELKNGHKDTVEQFLRGEFSAILAEGIETFAPQLGGPMDFITASGENRGPEPHGEAGGTEYPDGPYVHEGPSYRYRLNFGFFENGNFVNLTPPEYNLSVTRLGEQRGLPVRFSRKRMIKNLPAIE